MHQLHQLHCKFILVKICSDKESWDCFIKVKQKQSSVAVLPGDPAWAASALSAPRPAAGPLARTQCRLISKSGDASLFACIASPQGTSPGSKQ